MQPKKEFILFVIFLITLISSGVSRSESASLGLEERDMKFFVGDTICNITKKEQADIKSKINNVDTASTSFALQIVELRLNRNASFKDLDCAIRFYLDRYYSFAKTQNNSRYEKHSNYEVFSYAGLLKKIKDSTKYKADFEKRAINGAEYDYYFGLLGDNLESLDQIDIINSRKILANAIIRKGAELDFGMEEWQLFFDTYYLKNVAPPKEASGMILKMLSRGENYRNFLHVYLNSANELAYEDTFRIFFENFNIKDSSLSDRSAYNLNISMIKKLFRSKYLPESFKCNYAKEVIPAQLKEARQESVSEVLKIEHPCLKDALAYTKKFISPENACSYIKFEKTDDKKAVLSKMNMDFYKEWLDCRRKCFLGDKCSIVNTKNKYGSYHFLNAKYLDDFEIAEEVKTPSYDDELSFLNYKLKSSGICDGEVCVEKMLGCTETDILKQLNEELSEANYQSCESDSNCHVMVLKMSCLEVALNTRPKLPAHLASYAKTEAKKTIRMEGFLEQRLETISKACKKIFDQGSDYNCHSKLDEGKATKAKCLKNKCTIVQ